MNKKEEKWQRRIAMIFSLLIHAGIIIALAISSNNPGIPPSDSYGENESLIELTFLMNELSELSVPEEPAEPEVKEKPEASAETVNVSTPPIEELAKVDSLDNSVDTTMEKIEIKELEAIKQVITQDSMIAKIFEEETKKYDDAESDRRKREENRRFARSNYKMIRNFLKVYPYAIRTRSVVDSLNMKLAVTTDKKERRELIKKTEKELFGRFEKEIRGLSISQGKVLLKLISRETDQTAYELIKEYKGTLPAAFWQGIARLFGENLKTRYDSISEDKVLEEIIQKYHNDRESLNY
ncbi:MAG TPA: DUF4294 domain-containing protein [Bacteroidales bacterium]|nr:DUF4294 domain-containing protein [Bacteroidales bacterium]